MADRDRRQELRPAVDEALGTHSALLQSDVEIVRNEVRLLLEAAAGTDVANVERRMETVLGSCDALKAHAVGVRNIVTFLSETA